MKPHKHAELIKAWADGDEIERFSKIDNSWHYMEEPDWDKDYEYRVRPKVFQEWYATIDGVYRTEKSIYKANIKVWFDKETGELKSAEVLK